MIIFFMSIYRSISVSKFFTSPDFLNPKILLLLISKYLFFWIVFELSIFLQVILHFLEYFL